MIDIDLKELTEKEILEETMPSELKRYIDEISKKQRRAIFVYEGTRLHATYLDCPIIPKPWNERDEAFQNQFVRIVDDLCTGKIKWNKTEEDFEKAHDSWMEAYFKMGWRYGDEYDPANKLHPDLVTYSELNPKEKVKDEVFLKLVDIAKNNIW